RGTQVRAARHRSPLATSSSARQSARAVDRARALSQAPAGDRFLFASEPKAILAALPRVPDVSMAALREFLTFGYVAGGAAIFSGMSRLEPGSTLVLDPQRAPTVARYWTWPASSDVELPE